jgi:hypothetical protein
MNPAAIKKMTIIHELSRVPESSLDRVQRYLDAILQDIQLPVPTNQSLKGIWKHAGFEKIVNVEEEIRNVRHELQDAIPFGYRDNCPTFQRSGKNWTPGC